MRPAVLNMANKISLTDVLFWRNMLHPPWEQKSWDEGSRITLLPCRRRQQFLL